MRKIIHVDMDCFFAAVEMRDNPALRDIPIAIGGSRGQRRGLTRAVAGFSAVSSAPPTILLANTVCAAPCRQRWR